MMKRILFVTLSNIGDAVMTTPALMLLHQHYPHAVVDIVCDPRSAALFEHCPFRGRLLLRDKKQGWRGAWRLLRRCRQVEYDLVVDLKTDWLHYLVPAARKLGKLAASDWLDVHSVVKHAQALQPLLSQVTPPPVTLWCDRAVAPQLAQALPPRSQRKRLVLGLGANTDYKIWPAERYLALIRQLAGEIDSLIILGDQRDYKLAAVFDGFEGCPVYNWCGQLSLAASYAVLSQADAYIGNDSGLGHMAAAAGLPTFTLFGPGNPQRYLPWSPQALYFQDAGQHIDAITVAQVLPLIKTMLAFRHQRQILE